MLNFKSKRKIKITLVVMVMLVMLASVALIIFSFYGQAMMKKVPALSFDQALNYSLENNPDAIITVGVVKDGQASYTVYGNNGEVLSPELHRYEIGSLTKTFTAAMVAKAIQDGKLKVDDTIDSYLMLPETKDYPTIMNLLTHTSGYKAHYFEWVMASNFLTNKNEYFGVTKEMITKRMSSVNISNQNHDYEYSNFGYAVLGLILEKVYQEEYATLMNDYIVSELNLQNTQLSDVKGDLVNYWDWNNHDAYLPAGGLVSDIKDMLMYTQMQLDGAGYIGLSQVPLKNIEATSDQYKMLNIHLDSIGMAWIIDETNGITWHNGATDNFNSYLGFEPKSGTAVVILSNLSPNNRIPATVLGVKRLEEISSE